MYSSLGRFNMNPVLLCGWERDVPYSLIDLRYSLLSPLSIYNAVFCLRTFPVIQALAVMSPPTRNATLYPIPTINANQAELATVNAYASSDPKPSLVKWSARPAFSTHTAPTWEALFTGPRVRYRR